MAGKVTFSLEALQQQALEAADERIARAEESLRGYEDDTDLLAKQSTWRWECREIAKDLADAVEEWSDDQIKAFRFPPMPVVDQHSVVLARKGLANLREDRDRIAAKSKSLAPDENGNVHLTRSQMSEFFGL